MARSAWGDPSLGGSLLWRGRRESGQRKPYDRHPPTEGRLQGGSSRMLHAGAARGRDGHVPSGEPHRLPTLHTNGLYKTIYSAKPCFRDCFCTIAGLEPNEASNSQIIFDHFFNWRRIIET